MEFVHAWENQENQENGWKSKKIVKAYAGRKMASKDCVRIWNLYLEAPKEL